MSVGGRPDVEQRWPELLLFGTRKHEGKQIEQERKGDRDPGLGASSFITKLVSFDDLVRTMRTMTDYWLQIVSLPQQ